MTPVLGQSDLATLILYVIVGVIASGRITRLIVNDDYPPIVKFRIWWDNHVTGLWNKLMHCPWCLGPWVTLVVGFLAWLTDYYGVQIGWWIVFGWLAASYATSWVVYHDED